jgi:tetratricopeptide (TPR) repeat protein
VGLLDEARKGLHVVLNANPDDDWGLLSSGHCALYAGDYDHAEQHFRRALALNPTHLMVLLLHPLVPMYAGQFDEAFQKIRAAEKLVPGDSLLSAYQAILWAQQGNARRADRFLRAALKSRKTLLHHHHMLHYAAAACALLDRKSQALTLLKQAAKSGLPNFPLFRDEPYFHALLDYAPYQRFLGSLKKEHDSYRREFGVKN